MIKKLIALLLVLSFIFVDVLPGTFAWQSLVQEVTNELYGKASTTSYVRLEKREKGTGTPIPGAEFVLYKELGEQDEQIGGILTTDANGNIELHTVLAAGTYYFEEVNPSYGYTYDVENGVAVTKYPFVIQEGIETTTVVPAYNIRKTSTLQVTKTVKNADETALTEQQKAQTFTFTATFSDHGAYYYSIDGGTPVLLRSGETFKLSHGQVLVFANIPVGVMYTVTETQTEGYVITSDGHRGTIDLDGETASFVNTIGSSPPVDGELHITKRVENAPASDADKKFRFSILVNGEVRYALELAAGETERVSIPIGSTYEVREDDYFADGYIQTIYRGFGTMTETVVVTAVNTYQSEQVTITGQKSWQIGTADASVIPASITVLLKNGDIVVAEKEVTALTGWVYTFTADKYDSSGKEIAYTVEEVPVDGFTPVYDSGSYNITNIYQLPTAVPLPVVKKTIVSTNDVPGSRFTFVLRAMNAASPMPSGTVGTEKKLTLDSAGTLSFGTVAFTAPGTYVYEIYEETGSAAGWTYDTARYLLTYTVVVEEGQLSVVDTQLTCGGVAVPEIVFTNIYDDPQAETTTIRGVKTWNHGANPAANQPQSVEVILYANGTEYARRIVSAADGWSYAFDVPRCDANGQPITYTIGETPVSGYTAKVDGYNLINTYQGAVYDDPPIVVKYVEGTYAPKETFTFKFVGSPGAPMPDGAEGSIKTMTLTGPGLLEFGTIAFTTTGTYTYHIYEEKGSAAGWTYDKAMYTVTYVVTKDANGALAVTRTMVKNGTSAADRAVFTNSYTDPTGGTVTISGTKYWNHGTNPQAYQPTSVTVIVYGNGELAAQRTVTAADSWRYTFTLPKYDVYGNQIVYTLDEISIPGYSKQIMGYDLVNTYLPAVQVMTPAVVKKIEGEHAPKSTFTFTMTADGNSPMPDGANGNVKTVSMAGAGTLDFGVLTFTQPGIYTYQIREMAGTEDKWTYDDAVYTLTYHVMQANGTLQVSAAIAKDGNAASDIVFTNVYEDSVVISGTKYWNHGSNPQNRRPTSVVVYVYGNGLLVAQKRVTAADGWRYTFELPKFAENGMAIVYAVDEQPVSFYTKQIVGFDIYNTYYEPPSSEQDTPGSGTVDTPHTGDDSDLTPWMVLFAVSAAGMVMLLVMTHRLRRQKRRRKD